MKLPRIDNLDDVILTQLDKMALLFIEATTQQQRDYIQNNVERDIRRLYEHHHENYRKYFRYMCNNEDESV